MLEPETQTDVSVAQRVCRVLGEYHIHHPHQRQDILSNSRSLQHFDEQHILPPLYRWLEGTSASMPAERVVLHEKTTPAEDETLAREGEHHLLLGE